MIFRSFQPRVWVPSVVAVASVAALCLTVPAQGAVNTVEAATVDPAAPAPAQGADRGGGPTPPDKHTVSGCTLAPLGQVCIFVDGSPGTTKVFSAMVVRHKFDPGMICHFSGKVTITSPEGKVLWKESKSLKKCVPGRAYFNWKVDDSFPSGSKVCAQFNEDGSQQGGKPCITLKKK